MFIQDPNPKGILNKQSSSHILPTKCNPSCQGLQACTQGVLGVPAATRMVSTAQVGARMILWDPPRDLVASCGVLRAFQHIWVSTAQQCGGSVFGKLANDPTITPTASLHSSGNWSSPAGKAQQLMCQLIKREEAIRKSPFSIHSRHSCFS